MSTTLILCLKPFLKHAQALKESSIITHRNRTTERAVENVPSITSMLWAGQLAVATFHSSLYNSALWWEEYTSLHMKMVQFCVPLLLFSKATRATNCMFLLWGLLDMFMYFHWPFVVEKWQFSRVSGIICAPFSRENNIRWYEQKVQERKEMKKQLSGVFIFALTFGSAFAAIHMNAKKEFPLKSMREKGMTRKLRNENVNALGYFWHSKLTCFSPSIRGAHEHASWAQLRTWNARPGCAWTA